jgi:hypothetical protein
MIGHFLPDSPEILLTTVWIHAEEGDTTHPCANEFRFISLEDSTLGEILYSYRSAYNWRTGVGWIRPPAGNRLSRPADFNGDGYDDLILFTLGRAGDDITSNYETLLIYFSGSEFDSASDWSITRFWPRGSAIGYAVASGYDVNCDGYDDMLVRGYTRIDNDYYQSTLVYEIYLGGEVMDTIPDWRMYYDHFENRQLQTGDGNGWAMLPDINGDGCDDWGFWYWESIFNPDGPPFESNGYYIFFGGEDLDIEPDIELEEFPEAWVNDGEIIGGEFNEDGLGDILCSGPAYIDDALKRYYFGRRNWPHEPEPDLEYRGDVGGPSGSALGSIGDYNGDGADDYTAMEGYATSIVIISGFDNGDAVVEPELPPQSPVLSSKVYPNPFNDELTVSINLSKPSEIHIAIYDIAGRRIGLVHAGNLAAGDHQFAWNSAQSGIYFVVVRSGSQRAVHKVICLK